MIHQLNKNNQIEVNGCHKCKSFIFTKDSLKCAMCGEDRILSTYEEIARTMLSLIAQDNGANNILELKSERSKQPLHHVSEVRNACEIFFKDEDLVTDEIIEEICCGEQSEVQSKYGNINGFNQLITTLNNYFNNL